MPTDVLANYFAQNSFRSTFVFTLECSTLLKLKRGNVSAIFGLVCPIPIPIRILPPSFQLLAFRVWQIIFGCQCSALISATFGGYLWPELLCSVPPSAISSYR